MIVEFNIYDWRDIQATSGLAVGEDEAREMLRYIKFKCEDNRFETVGCNGYMLTRLNGPCNMTDPAPVEFLLPPMKAPAKTVSVRIMVNAGSNHTVFFYDKNNGTTGVETVPVPSGEFPQVEEKVLKPAIQKHEKYQIAVNPVYLLNALQGMKDYETVIFTFGENTESFTVHPFRKDGTGPDALSLVFPVRMFGFGGAING